MTDEPPLRIISDFSITENTQNVLCIIRQMTVFENGEKTMERLYPDVWISGWTASLSLMLGTEHKHAMRLSAKAVSDNISRRIRMNDGAFYKDWEKRLLKALKRPDFILDNGRIAVLLAPGTVSPPFEGYIYSYICDIGAKKDAAEAAS